MDLSTILDLLLPIGDVIARLWRVLPDAWNKFMFRRFWGPGALSDEAYFVIDTYRDTRPRSVSNRYEKEFPRRRPKQTLRGGDIIYGTFSPEASAICTAFFFGYTEKLLKVVADEEVDERMDATLICYGSSDSNLKTFDVETLAAKRFYSFEFGPQGQRAFRLKDALYVIEQRDKTVYDKAVLVKMTNPQNPDHSYAVCAGLSEWGSLAAVRYLAHNWKSLYKRFRRKDFCVLLEVPYGHYESAREVIHDCPS